MKRLILSTVCMLFCATGLWAQILVDGIYYNFDTSTQTASVTNKSGGYSLGSNSYSGSITIPSTVAYNGTSYSVTSIGEYAFDGCKGLTNITIPNSVTSIGNNAFYKCKGLTSITIPNSVTSIGNLAFDGCKGLTSITIPNSVTTIESSAFSGCSGLTSITIPNSVTSIGGHAFYDCDGLTSITIPNSVTTIESSAFSGCSGLTSITIPNSVTSIETYAFADCSGLTSITIPNSVTSIETYAFADCSGLTSITIPNSVTSIGNYAFKNCSGLTSVTIGNGVTSMGSHVFDGTAWFNNQPDGLVYAGKIAYEYKGTKPNDGTSIVLKDGTLGIADYAFDHCTGLTSVTIPNSVTSIGGHAFYDCDGLTSITIPNSVTSIGNEAFDGTAWFNNQPDGLVYAGKIAYEYKGPKPNYGTSIVLKDGTLGIADLAFDHCTGLTSIDIPNSVIKIGECAFLDCRGLTSVTVEATNPPLCGLGMPNYNIPLYVPAGSIDAYKAADEWKKFTNIQAIPATGSLVDGDFVFSDDKKTTLLAYIGNGGDVTIPSSVTSIGDYAFYRSGLTSVTIPNSVTSIGKLAFASCSGLTSVTIPNSVTSIGDSAFYNCTELTSITIPNSVTSIGYKAFHNCSGLTSVTIPSSVTSIGNEAFENCSGLTSVTIPSSVTSIGNEAFHNCSGLTSITIPNSVTSIGYGAFFGCNNIETANINSQAALDAFNFTRKLRGITLGDKITSIGDEAFKECSGLTSITIPNSVTSIGYRAFYRCDGLTSITIPNSVTSIGNEAFKNCSGLTSIIVPCGKYGYFTGIFTEYTSIIHCASEVVTNVNNEKYGTVTGEGVYEYGTSITLTAMANEHCHFVKWNDGNTENPRTVQVTQDGTFTAIFAIDEHKVTLSKNISDAGIVTGDGVYEYGTSITLTATPNEGCSFKGWSDGVKDASREITVTKDTSITAIFVAYYKIKTLSSASQGTIIGGGIYEHGEIATLVANAKPGYVFAQWADGNDENPRYVTVDGNKTYTAIFIEGEQDKYMITWKNWDGRVIKTSEVSYGEVPVFNGEKPTRPDEAGYTFTFNGWSPTIAAASQNAEYTANYIQTATESEKTTIENEGDISVTTTDNTALFTWPENASADTYTLTITRNDEVFCSLTFDGQGRLINLNFPNLRASAEGYRFTVTGLNSGTDYAYDLKAKNGAATVNEYTGEFRTSGVATAVPEAEESIVETARYDINGRKLNAPTKGVNIVKYSDGSFEKEFVK